jgi:hypothetical protein
MKRALWVSLDATWRKEGAPSLQTPFAEMALVSMDCTEKSATNDCTIDTDDTPGAVTLRFCSSALMGAKE